MKVHAISKTQRIWRGSLALAMLSVLNSACVAADCGWNGVGYAWIDQNANGRMDEGEPPLTDVRFHVDDTDGFTDIGEGPSISNWKGEAHLFVFLFGCPEVTFEVYADAPPGYRLTTAPRLSAHWRDSDRTFGFGFAHLSGVPTATPRPPAPECISYKVAAADQYDLTDLAVASDGTAWVTTFGNGVSRFLPEANEWVVYKATDGLVSDDVRSVTVVDDGTVWFASDGGASYFDGASWHSYTTSAGLVHNNVYKVAVDMDGTVWFATEGGVSHLDPATDSWRTYTAQDGLSGDFASYVAVAPDRSVWFPVVTAGVSRLIRPQGSDEPPKWIHYSKYIEDSTYIPFDFVDDIEFHRDGSYWFGGLGGLMRYDPESEEWTEHDYSSTNGMFTDDVNAFTIASDGSIWIASGQQSPLVFHFIPAVNDSDRDIWRSYDRRDGLPSIDSRANGARAIAIGPDEAIWVGTQEHATRCVFTE